MEAMLRVGLKLMLLQKTDWVESWEFLHERIVSLKVQVVT